MSHHTSPRKTAAADKVPFWEKFFYGAGSGSFQLASEGVKGLGYPIYNITLGLNPALVGLVLMISRIVDAFTDPLIGKLSDDTRTRWGRRRPFIFVGSFLAAGSFILIWFVPEGWAGETAPLFTFYLITMLVFFFCATIQVVPYHTLGLEMTADYNERTVVTGYKMMFGFAFTLLLPWVFRFAQSDAFEGNTMAGMRYWSFILAGVILIGGILPALFVKERYYHIAKNQAKTSFWKGVNLTFQNRAFLLLTAIILTVGIGFGTVNALGPYIIYYHIYDGDTKVGAELVAIGVNLFAITALLVTPVIAKICARLGKVQTLVFVVALGMVASGLSYFCYSKEHPLLVFLVYVLIAPQASGFWMITTSMKADVCDDDELRNGMRREGMFGAIGNWILKITMSSTFLLSGLILEITGFNVELKGDQAPETIFWMRLCFAVLPMLSSSIAFYLLSRYPLTSGRMADIRQQLEARRSPVSA